MSSLASKIWRKKYFALHDTSFKKCAYFRSSVCIRLVFWMISVSRLFTDLFVVTRSQNSLACWVFTWIMTNNSFKDRKIALFYNASVELGGHYMLGIKQTSNLVTLVPKKSIVIEHDKRISPRATQYRICKITCIKMSSNRCMHK